MPISINLSETDVCKEKGVSKFGVIIFPTNLIVTKGCLPSPASAPDTEKLDFVVSITTSSGVN